MDLRIGDIVGRRSYGCDIVFKVHDILRQGDSYVVVLKGINLRILADAPESDIVKLPSSKINEDNDFFSKKISKLDSIIRKNIKKMESGVGGIFPYRSNAQMFKRPGRVLHLDGDNSYLEMCLKSYKELNIEAVGHMVVEADQPKRVVELLKQHNPDIVVLTGHDAMLKNNNANDRRNINSLDNYRNSKYYIEAVKEARKYEPSLDDLVIFAGACQSYFEGIIEAGANFASSPERILIHALDPVMICESIAFTPVDKLVPLAEMLNNTISGLKGVGGVQTRGKCRDGMPKTPYNTM